MAKEELKIVQDPAAPDYKFGDVGEIALLKLPATASSGHTVIAALA